MKGIKEFLNLVSVKQEKSTFEKRATTSKDKKK